MGGFSKERLGRLHGALARHVECGAMPGLVALVSRRGEVHVEAIGTKDFGGDRGASGVLIARAAGQPLETFLRERIFEPLGMKDTGFHVPPDKTGRLPGCYQGKDVYDDPRDSQWSRPPDSARGPGLLDLHVSGDRRLTKPAR